MIDGLAGTGKTSVLSYRGVVRCSTSPHNTNILVTASKEHVVNRLSKTMDEIKENGAWPSEFKMEKILSPGISSEKVSSKDLSTFTELIPSDGFDEIILDESQDITFAEFVNCK